MKPIYSLPFALSYVVTFCGLNAVYANQATEFHTDICESYASALKKINPEDPDERKWEVSYHDHNNLPLFNSGLVLRARRKKSHYEFTVKIKGLNLQSLRGRGDLDGADWKCETDSYGGHEQSSCSVDWTVDDLPFRLSHHQELFLKNNSVETPKLWELKRLGPLPLLSTKFSAAERDLTLEEVSLRNGTKFLDLSYRSESPGPNTEENFRAWIEKKQLRVCPEQGSKTETILRSLVSADSPDGAN